MNAILLAHGLYNPDLIVRVFAANFTALNRSDNAVDTAAAAVTATLPANPKAGWVVVFRDYSRTFDTNPLTILRNGQLIGGVADDYQINTKGGVRKFIYVDTVKGWVVE